LWTSTWSAAVLDRLGRSEGPPRASLLLSTGTASSETRTRSWSAEAHSFSGCAFTIVAWMPRTTKSRSRPADRAAGRIRPVGTSCIKTGVDTATIMKAPGSGARI
jgi:hypothetical protein